MHGQYHLRLANVRIRTRVAAMERQQRNPGPPLSGPHGWARSRPYRRHVAGPRSAARQSRRLRGTGAALRPGGPPAGHAPDRVGTRSPGHLSGSVPEGVQERGQLPLRVLFLHLDLPHRDQSLPRPPAQEAGAQGRCSGRGGFAGRAVRCARAGARRHGRARIRSAT